MDETDLAFAGIARQAELIRAGEVSPRELVTLYVERIRRLDPDLNAFRIVMEESALAQADQASARLAAGDDRPLLGVPIAVKDNMDVIGERTLHGSGVFGPPATADTEMVRRLRAAGAIPIGKTQMPELAIFPWTESATWGVTRNPWDADLTTGGSSGGSAAAVAAGLAGAATASDGGGSIRIPAACCGLFGLKPQRDRVSLAPDTDHWHGLSVYGCVTRTVADTALYLDVVADGAPGFAESALRPPGKLRIALTFKAPSRARLDPHVRAAVEGLADVLRGLGHTVERVDPDYGLIEPLFIPLWMRGIHDDAVRLRDRKRLERRTRALARQGGLFAADVVRRSRVAGAARAERINRVLEKHDVLLMPMLPAPPQRVGRFEGRSWLPTSLGAAETVTFANVWNVTGQPAASVPTPASDDGVPLAGQLVGRPHDEATLIALSAQLEREIGWPARRPPVD